MMSSRASFCGTLSLLLACHDGHTTNSLQSEASSNFSNLLRDGLQLHILPAHSITVNNRSLKILRSYDCNISFPFGIMKYFLTESNLYQSRRQRVVVFI